MVTCLSTNCLYVNGHHHKIMLLQLQRQGSQGTVGGCLSSVKTLLEEDT